MQAAIVIKNKYMHQLKRPFPFYVEGYESHGYDKYVAELNYNFLKFYGEENVRKVYLEMKRAKSIHRQEKKSAKKEKRDMIREYKQKAKEDKLYKNLRKDKLKAITLKDEKIKAADKKFEFEITAARIRLNEVKKANAQRLKKWN